MSIKENNLYELIDYIFGQIFNNRRLIYLFVKKNSRSKKSYLHIFLFTTCNNVTVYKQRRVELNDLKAENGILNSEPDVGNSHGSGIRSAERQSRPYYIRDSNKL